jgi:DNA-binding IclR family transcriptional regulator
VSVSGLASRMTAAQVRRLAPEVVAAAHQISAALGHR